jgi:hypothetical protein
MRRRCDAFSTTIFLAALAGLLVSCSEKTTECIWVDYVPFKLRTLVAVTEGNIHRSASHSFCVTSSEEQSKLLNLLKGAESDEFEDDEVRLRVLSNSGNFWVVDSSGGVLSRSGKVRLGRSSFDALTSLLKEWTNESPRN